MANNSRIVPVPDRGRSAHAVFSATASDSDAPLSVPSATLLRHFGASDEALAALNERPHCQAILTDVPLHEARQALLAARQQAFEQAAATDGIVIDLTVPRVVIEPPTVSLAIAAQWVAFDLDQLVLSSRGLEAFGLPEIRLDAANPGETAMVLAVATGLSHRLIAEWPDNDPVGPASVTLRDIAHGFGDPDATSAPTEPALDVLLSYTDDCLAVAIEGKLTDLFPVG